MSLNNLSAIVLAGSRVQSFLSALCWGTGVKQFCTITGNRSILPLARVCQPMYRVVRVPQVGWSDWGTKERILTSLQEIGKLMSAYNGSGHPQWKTSKQANFTTSKNSQSWLAALVLCACTLWPSCITSRGLSALYLK